MKFTDDMEIDNFPEYNINLEAQKEGQKPTESRSLASFYEVSGTGAVLWRANHVIIEIEDKMFQRNYNEMIGNKALINGFFTIFIWDKVKYDYDDPKKVQPDTVFIYNLPTKFQTEPRDITNITRRVDGKDTKIIQFHYEDGDAFMSDIEVTKDRQNAVDFVQMILGNVIPNNVRIFGNFPFLFSENAALNGIDYGVDATRFDMMEAILTRSKGNMEVPYRMDRSKGMMGARIDDIPAMINTFGGASFRDPIASSTSAIIRARNGVEETTLSPIEETMKY